MAAQMEHFEAVVVGSGFGGSVMAYRLAEAGRSVCLLERGKPYPPGSFARSPHEMARNFWDPSAGQHGLFDIWSFKHLEAVVSSGLGGGSLIYANVLIRKPEQWFVEEDARTGALNPWPVQRKDLEKHYDRVERVLDAQKYPFEKPPYDRTSKTLAMQWASQRLGYNWYLPNLAIAFANAGSAPAVGEPLREAYANLHGAPRSTCRLCGECDLGCNFGSKNTLDYNYLSLAKLKGADIRTRCEVRSFAPRDGENSGYSIDYVIHDPADEGHPTDTDKLELHRVTADRLILSAGALGTGYLLAKNRANFPRISAQLGRRFSSNGDLLAFAMRCTKEAHDGKPGGSRLMDPSYGPVITSTIEARGGTNRKSHQGFFLQDAGYPQFFNWLIESTDVSNRLTRAAKFAWRRMKQRLTGEPYGEISSQLSELIGDCELSSGSMPLLGMGRDTPDGNVTLETGRDGKRYLEVDWSDKGSADYFNWVGDTARKIADVLGGDFVEDPDSKYLGRMITVHPLGGCAMAESPEAGVVDSYGEVFGHPGLYVADGSVMPGPTGSNPSLTIAALADRFADRILGV